MPCVRVETNCPLPDATATSLLRELRTIVTTIKGDRAEMVAVSLVSAVRSSFGEDGTSPAAIVHVTNAAMPREVTEPLTAAITACLTRHLEVDPRRMYIFYQAYVDPSQVGWNGATFASILAARTTSGASRPSEEGT